MESQKLHTDVSFIVDTGADKTVLMPMDAAKMGLNYELFDKTTTARGIGGSVTGYIETANLIFRGNNNDIYVHTIDIKVFDPSAHLDDIPSILGRDVMENWKINYHPDEDTLEAEVLVATEVISGSLITP